MLPTSIAVNSLVISQNSEHTSLCCVSRSSQKITYKNTNLSKGTSTTDTGKHWEWVPKMVNFYPAEGLSNREAPPMPIASRVTDIVAMNSVKNLVCSPDVTVFTGPSGESLESITEDKLYQCLMCHKTFSQKSVYQSHVRSHSKEGEDPYRCNICSKTFAVPARLTRHFRTHTGEKPYQCEYCNKSFSVKENLSVHRRIHTKERPYKCDVCERAFEHSGKLHRHMRIHTGERPHKCSECAKTFIQSGQLVIHMRTHTGEKPYVCKECGKGFTCSKQLKVHTRTHTGEKPYTCDICGKSFGYNHVLKLHQVAHYGEKVYKCTLCHETFNSKKTMELHIKTHSDSPGSGSPRNASPVEPVIEISQLGSGGGVGSDKENKTDPATQATGYSQSRDFAYYLYPRDQYSGHAPSPTGVNPALLAAAAAAAAEDRTFQPSPETYYLYPPPAAAFSTYGLPDPAAECALLDLPGNDARRRVEAALEVVEEQRQRECGLQRQPILTPPSSNPVSPAPSPDPLDLAVPVRETLILPPRKRSKMILESMESERTGIASQRQSSVIQYARAS
ncbi:Krueppel homolog 1-like isoform X1 [Neodiprion virginianus]|uniref:Krueppel homolog 1-like isoform X1 n=2 Tax=Neodiprion virginianus TaxID=2961670 RepID=UPI001EE69AE1|nr:Krueppel homolog 1-like isoform X1 [Neodiprion virginianus]